jgi:hypothetical protein
MGARKPIRPVAELSNVVVIGYTPSDNAHHVFNKLHPVWSTRSKLKERIVRRERTNSWALWTPTLFAIELFIIQFIPLNILYCQVSCKSKGLRTVCKDEKCSINCNFEVQMWPYIAINSYNKPTWCTNFSFFWNKTLHVSDSSSVHHQEFFHCIHTRPVWHTIAVFTVKKSWWWTEELSETCRVLFQK